VVKAGNRIVPGEDGGYIENKKTGEMIEVREEKDTYVFDIQIEDGDMVMVTLGSGAGCNVWPKGKRAGRSVLELRKKGIKMMAANGTEIKHYGQRTVQFRGIEATKMVQATGFPWRT
jgi:hypothetical protein